MTEHTWWETLHAEDGRLLDQTKKLIEDGNIRRVVVKTHCHFALQYCYNSDVLRHFVFGLASSLIAPPTFLSFEISLGRALQAPTRHHSAVILSGQCRYRIQISIAQPR
jgi:hypothetical protein